MIDLRTHLLDETTWGEEASKLNFNLEKLKNIIESMPAIKLVGINSINGIRPDASGNIYLTPYSVNAIPFSSYGSSFGTPKLDEFGIIYRRYLPEYISSRGLLFGGIADLGTIPNDGFYILNKVGEYINFIGSTNVPLTVTKEELRTNIVIASHLSGKWDKVYLPLPDISSITWETLQGKPELSSLAISGSWVDILGKPNFSAVAVSGDYADLIGTPNLHKVAISGDFKDLKNVPDFITSAQKNTKNGPVFLDESGKIQESIIPDKFKQLSGASFIGLIYPSRSIEDELSKTTSPIFGFAITKGTYTYFGEIQVTDEDLATSIVILWGRNIYEKLQIPLPAKEANNASFSEAELIKYLVQNKYLTQDSFSKYSFWGNHPVNGEVKGTLNDVENINLSGDINFKNGSYVSNSGDAKLERIIVDRIHDKNSDESSRTIVGADGFDMYVDEYGKSHLYVDFAVIRNTGFFANVEIRRVSYSNGMMLLSNAGAKFIRVKEIRNEDDEVIAYKCYEQSDDGTTSTTNSFEVGMQAYCQTFNVKEGVYKNLRNSYYWRLVIGVGEERIDDKTYNYVILSNVERFVGTDLVPHYVPNYNFGEDAKEEYEPKRFCDIIKDRLNLTQDENGTLLETKIFRGYDPAAPQSAPEVSDVIVQAGDQIRPKTKGNIIQIATSSEAGADDSAPFIKMFHLVGSDWVVNNAEGNSTRNPFLWKRLNMILSPSIVRINSNIFQWITDDGDYVDPITVWYEIVIAQSSLRVDRSNGRIQGGVKGFLYSREGNSPKKPLSNKKVFFGLDSFTDSNFLTTDSNGEFTSETLGTILGVWSESSSPTSVNFIYTAGTSSDTILASSIQQINVLGSKGEKGEAGTPLIQLNLSLESGSVFYREGQEDVAKIKATVFRGEENITNSYLSQQFVWTRRSEASEREDTSWNERHVNAGTTLSISYLDLVGTTDIICTVYDIHNTEEASERISIN